VASKKWARCWTFEADDDFRKNCVLLQDTYTLTLILEYPNTFHMKRVPYRGQHDKEFPMLSEITYLHSNFSLTFVLL
jgi:hypothetical protein